MTSWNHVMDEVKRRLVSYDNCSDSLAKYLHIETNLAAGLYRLLLHRPSDGRLLEKKGNATLHIPAKVSIDQKGAFSIYIN